MLIRKKRLINKNSAAQPSVLQIQYMLKIVKFLKGRGGVLLLSYI